jgi:hypothetical protein
MILDDGDWPARLLSRIPVLNRFAPQPHMPGRQGYFRVRILPRSSMSDQVYLRHARQSHTRVDYHRAAMLGPNHYGVQVNLRNLRYVVHQA